tara:strand:- start:138 stop:284 length:147 start_codon:yes stop_codon:yes gene_type:complete
MPPHSAFSRDPAADNAPGTSKPRPAPMTKTRVYPLDTAPRDGAVPIKD